MNQDFTQQQKRMNQIQKEFNQKIQMIEDEKESIESVCREKVNDEK